MKKKVTFTLPKYTIKDIKKRVFKIRQLSNKVTYSDVVTMYLEYSFKDMEDELIERNNMDNPPSLYSISKKLHFTIPKTYVIPMEVSEKLNYYSMRLGLKKSHLIILSCKIFEKENEDKINQKILELLDTYNKNSHIK